MKALITKKIGMTTILGDNGESIGVTLLSAAPNVISQVKDQDKDGYSALQIGAGVDKKAGKSKQGHFKAAGIVPKIVREIRVSELPKGQTVGDQLSADIFSVGDTVDATGITKGKGFAGTIKRHNFQRGRKTHGGRSYRRPGSIGSMYPQRIFKGKKMAGQMGHEQRTVKRLTIALVDAELNVIGVRGAVPGPNKGIVMIKDVK